MQLSDAAQAWRRDGFAIVPGYLSAADLAPALDELGQCFPPPGHPFWTAETLAGTALRYPGLDLAPWVGVL